MWAHTGKDHSGETEEYKTCSDSKFAFTYLKERECN